MKVTAIKLYFDRELKRNVKPNEVLEVTVERGKALVKGGAAVEVKEKQAKTDGPPTGK